MPTVRERGVAPKGQEAIVSALGVRVDDLAENVRGIWGELRGIEARMASATSVKDIAEKLDRLVSQQAERNKTPWPTLASFGSLILVIVFAWSTAQTEPIKADIRRVDTDSRLLMRDTVGEFKEVRNLIVPRGEHEQRWANATAMNANLQRQIDDNAKAFGSTYSLRDAITDLNKRLDRLESKNGG